MPGFKLVSLLTGLVICVASVLGPAAPPAKLRSTIVGLDMPGYRQLLQGAEKGALVPQPSATPVTALVAFDRLPLMAVPASAQAAEARALGAAQDELASLVRHWGGSVEARLSQAVGGLIVRIDQAHLAELRSHPTVAAILPVNDYAVAQTSGGPATTLQEVSKLIGADQVRAAGNSGQGVAVAVIDSGVDYTHARMGGSGLLDDYYRAYCGGAALRPGDPGCNPALDPPADLFPNGKVRGGYDYVGDVWPEPDPTCDGAAPCIKADRNPIDGSGHGTHVADIAVGLPQAADGADAGMAPGADLWAFKACNGAAGRCDGTALLLALDSALDLDGSNHGRCRSDLGEVCASYDPADVIVMAVSFPYGQPEDALTLFVDMAGYYGSLVVAAAGNDGDTPYIIGSPAVSSAALAVAESTFPSAEPLLLADGQPLDARMQDWSAPLTPEAGGSLRYGDGANTTGCTAMAAWSGPLLLDRGGCLATVKVENATAAGASMLLIADTRLDSSPPALPGEASDLPVSSTTRAEADALRDAVAAGEVMLSVHPVSAPAEQIAASASRGPRIFDSAIKPDIAAPGAIRSAQAGSGTALSAFGGSSGAAPVVAGAAVLIIQELEDRGLINTDAGLRDPTADSLSLGPLVKALLMNTANPDLRRSNGGVAPATLRGAGRINAFEAFRSQSLAVDATAMVQLFATTPVPGGCSVSPYRDLINYLIFKIPPPCARDTPYGNQLMNAWNAQTGSLSFGYHPVVGYREIQRQVAVMNYSIRPHTYTLSIDLQDAAERGRGVEIDVTPRSLTLAGRSFELVTVTLRLNARDLPDWELNGGERGNQGACPPDAPADCPSLDRYEVEGALRIDGGSRNQMVLPWAVLPHKSADTALARRMETQLILCNPAEFAPGPVDVFALVDMSLNQCDQRSGTCISPDYTVGARPGSAESPPDLNTVSVRGSSRAGLNASFGLPPAPAGTIPDELVEFAVTLYDKPYRATPNTPVRIEVAVDANRDGSSDYLIYNADAGSGTDGRSAVFVRDVNPVDGTRPERYYQFTDADFHSQSLILPVPAAAVGLRSDQPFNFVVRAYDTRFGGAAWDCSPGSVAGCLGAHTFQTGQPRFIPDTSSLQVPPAGRFIVNVDESSAGAVASPSQIGLLLLYRNTQPGQAATPVRLR